MVDTCGKVVPEGAQACLRCQQQSSIKTSCPDCAGELQVMHTSYYYASTGLVRSTLYHCINCDHDWELEVPLIEQPGNFKRKLWG